MIELGRTVRNVVTGEIGIATARVVYLGGYQSVRVEDPGGTDWVDERMLDDLAEHYERGQAEDVGRETLRQRKAAKVVEMPDVRFRAPAPEPLAQAIAEEVDGRILAAGAPKKKNRRERDRRRR